MLKKVPHHCLIQSICFVNIMIIRTDLIKVISTMMTRNTDGTCLDVFRNIFLIRSINTDRKKAVEF
jgi:hypothetical protein